MGGMLVASCAGILGRDSEQCSNAKLSADRPASRLCACHAGWRQVEAGNAKSCCLERAHGMESESVQRCVVG